MVCFGFLYSGRIIKVTRIVSVHCVGRHPGLLKCRFNFPYHSHQCMVNEFYVYPINSRVFFHCWLFAGIRQCSVFLVDVLSVCDLSLQYFELLLVEDISVVVFTL